MDFVRLCHVGCNKIYNEQLVYIKEIYWIQTKNNKWKFNLRSKVYSIMFFETNDEKLWKWENSQMKNCENWENEKIIEWGILKMRVKNMIMRKRV